jgi:hypothetical protein
MGIDLYRDDSMSIIEFCSGNGNSSVQIGMSSGYVQLDEETALIVAETLAVWLNKRIDKERSDLNERANKNRNLQFGLVNTAIKMINLNSDLIGE